MYVCMYIYIYIIYIIGCNSLEVIISEYSSLDADVWRNDIYMSNHISE